MSDIDLRADCARCAALCCVAFHFDRSDQFAFDKRAGEACRHLDRGGRCRIYGQRTHRGFRGCAGYDCHGAGQWVTQALFGGRSWIEAPELLSSMMEAFLRVERAHGLLLLLREARKLDLSPAPRRRLDQLDSEVGQAATKAGPVAALEVEVRCFLRALRGAAGRGRALRTG